MDKEQRSLSDIILNLTLEIIYLLTGEDYGPLKKSFSDHEMGASQTWSKARSPNPKPPCSSLTTESSKKILRATKKILELLGGEVPIGCQEEVALYFSMEEQKCLTPEVMMEDKQTYSEIGPDLPDDNSSLTQNGERSSECSNAKNQSICEVVAPDELSQQMSGCYQKEHCGPNQIPDTDKSTSCDKRGYNIIRFARTDPTEEPSLRDNTIHEDKELSDCEEPLVMFRKNHARGSSSYPNVIELEIKQEKGPCDGEICTITESDAVKTVNSKENNTEEIDFTSLDQAVVEMKEEIEADAVDGPDAMLMSGQISCNGEKEFSFNDQSLFDPNETNDGEQNQFECSECGECFSKNSQLVEHHRLHSAEKPFACPECGKQFADRAKVVAHQLTHSTPAETKTENSAGEGLVLCSECGMGFTNRPALEEHQKVHKQEKAFVCQVCGKSFSRRGHLSNHNRIHTGGKRISDAGESKYLPHGSYVRKRPFMCPECGKWFPSRSHLDRHQRIHTGEKPYSCNECDRRFTDRSGLVIHQRVHTGEKPYSCDECGKRFRDRSGLVVHQRNHTGESPFKCHQCGKCFHNRLRLERHESVHVKNKDFSCPDCELCFPSISTLALHRQTHFGQLPPLMESTRFSPPSGSQANPKSFCCSECGKSFADLSTLSLHVRAHKTGDQQQVKVPSVSARLEPQQKIFTAESSLHLDGLGQPGLKRKEKPYSCSQCDLSFPDRASYLAHEEKHSEEKPYKCSKCGEGFVLKGYLTKHLQTHG
ncbi:uncharacterized protein PAF06_001272 [Gastrophryne carolinensis]